MFRVRRVPPHSPQGQLVDRPHVRGQEGARDHLAVPTARGASDLGIGKSRLWQADEALDDDEVPNCQSRDHFGEWLQRVGQDELHDISVVLRSDRRPPGFRARAATGDGEDRPEAAPSVAFLRLPGVCQRCCDSTTTLIHLPDSAQAPCLLLDVRALWQTDGQHEQS